VLRQRVACREGQIRQLKETHSMKTTSHLKEPFCALSHGIGVLLSLAGLVALLILARGEAWRTVALSIYGASLILLYVASTLYHTFCITPQHGSWLARFDYSAIYLLIAGSYTPVCLVTLRGAWGWSLLAVVWTLAIAGVVTSLAWKDKPPWLRITAYILMGWLIVLALAPLRASWPPEAFVWLLIGGLAYSVGVVVLATDKPHLWPGKFSAHDLWHLFVLGGSACHFILMLKWIAPL
jgi:hemolysin III